MRVTIIRTSRPHCNYIGQTRCYGHRKWRTVTGNCKSAESAMAKAVLAMSVNDHRARVLFIDSSGYRESHIAMELKR